MCFLGAFMLMMPPAMANTEELKSFKDWQVYKQESDQGRICFMSALTKNLRGDYDRANRGETRVFVSHGPGAKGGYLFWPAIAIKNGQKLVFNRSIKARKLFLPDSRKGWSQGQKTISV